MKISLSRSGKVPDGRSAVYIVEKGSGAEMAGLDSRELACFNKRKKDEKGLVIIDRLDSRLYLVVKQKKKNRGLVAESLRKQGNLVQKDMNASKLSKLVLLDSGDMEEDILAFAEGLLMGNYQFLKYFRDAGKKKNSLSELKIISKKLNREKLDQLENVSGGVFHVRDLVNEPLSALNAVELAARIEEMGKEAGFGVEVFNKKKIESLKMGGLLAVNMGSIDPPTFTIMEWKPENAVNTKPLVLVGKGVVYDTGGLSLKPTKGSMDSMKSDMAGAATVAGTMYAIAKSALPVHVIALVPATDNRPDGNAYVPGDVIHMGNGMTVEVLNTDAEGRMILAEALHYARNYDPSLIIDVATLTGSAAVAVGKYGVVGMGNAPAKQFRALQESGNRVFERVVEFPFWDDYNEMLKSTIADIKNIGERDGGAITAGKFLENFTNDYPYIHLDIAGVAFLDREYDHRGKGGTGTGVRLLFDFIKSYPWK